MTTLPVKLMFVLLAVATSDVSARFSWNECKGLPQLGKPCQQETGICVQPEDEHGEKYGQMYCNVAPVLVSPADGELPTEVPEDIAPGEIVYTFAATDDSTPVADLVYQQIPATSSPFEIVGNTLQTKADMSPDDLDREQSAVDTYSIAVTVTDGTLTDTTTLVLSITDVNDHTPEFAVSNYMVEIEETAKAGSTLFTVTAFDLDATYPNNDITFSISGDNSDHFEIDGSTGEVTVASPSVLSASAVSTYDLAIMASDGGTPANSATVSATINILSVSDGVTGFGETFNAPGFPGPYENNTYWDHCWTSPPGTTITLTFPSIEIECNKCADPAIDCSMCQDPARYCPDPYQCAFDYIRIDENNDGYYEIPMLCSTHTHYVYAASSNYVCLIFKTDAACTYGGFDAVATYA